MRLMPCCSGRCMTGPLLYRASYGCAACFSQCVKKAPVANTDALMGRCAMRILTDGGGMRVSAGSAAAWARGTIGSATLGPLLGLAAQACRRCGSRGCPSGIAR